MAIVSVGTKAINYTFEDRDGNTATLTLYAPADVITEDVETWATTTGAALVQALSDSQIRSVTIVQSYEEDTIVQPVEASDVERKGVWDFKVAGGGHSTFRVPSIKNTLVIDGTKFINRADAAVVAFEAAVIDTGLFDLYGLGNFRGDKLTALNNIPFKSHRGSQNG